MLCYLFPEPSYLFFSSDLPGLLYYSHIPATIIALLVGFFVFWNGREFLLNRLLFAISIFFSLWTVSNLIVWTNIHSDFMLFVWSFFGILSGLLSIFSVYFVYVFLNKKDVSNRLKLVFLGLIAPVLVLAPTALNMNGYDITACDAFAYENVAFYTYYTLLGVLAMVWIFVLLIARYRKAAPEFKKQIVLLGIGIEFFLFFFFSIIFLASYLTSLGFLGSSEFEFYAFFGMIVFMAYIGVLLVQFKTFHVGLLSSQALVVALIILIGSQFTFTRSTTNIVLTSIALILTGVIGIILIRSVKREILQRKHIEELAGELEKSNKQQIILIHFITHQIKGFLTKSRNIFATALDGDMGIIPETMKPMLEEGLRSDTKGVSTIQEILNAANIKSGKVSYQKAAFDMNALVTDIVTDLKPIAEQKDLELSTNLPPEPVVFTGDRLQLQNAFKNLIDNSIKYTLKGSVKASLAHVGTKVRFEIVDTGVGITAEDMGHLFTEGGHGKNSQKVNVESTGFGLYIVKNIIEAHDGRVWAESEGEGKGSRFIVELPA